jgi:hypothetical protein
LRVASRRRATYSSRAVAVAIAVLLGIWIMLTLPRILPTAEVGAQLFRALCWFTIAYCLIAGTKTTADCLSSEKREGTLGLLFLTDLRRYDVLFGKLAATSLDALYSVLGILPVLAIPMLMGGVTVAEFCRAILVVFGVLLFALSSGIFASSISRMERKAFGGAYLLVLLLTIGITVVAAALDDRGHKPLAATVRFMSPLWACSRAFEAEYLLAPHEYFLSTTFTFGYSFLLLALSSSALANSWADRPERTARSGWREKLRRKLRGPATVEKRVRASLLDRNPVLWLACRERHVLLYPWLFLGSMAIIWCYGFLELGKIIRLEGTVVTFYCIHLVLKYWLATIACNGFNTDRDQGALEIILSTPLRVRDILGGQWLTLWRLFGWPILTLIVAEIAMLWSLHGISLLSERSNWVPFAAAGLVLLLADCAALGWLGMWLGIRARTPYRATSGAVVIVLTLPCAILFGYLTLSSLFDAAIPNLVWILLWLVNGLVTDVLVIVWARRRFRVDLRRAVAERHIGNKRPQ